MSRHPTPCMASWNKWSNRRERKRCEIDSELVTLVNRKEKAGACSGFGVDQLIRHRKLLLKPYTSYNDDQLNHKKWRPYDHPSTTRSLLPSSFQVDLAFTHFSSEVLIVPQNDFMARNSNDEKTLVELSLQLSEPISPFSPPSLCSPSPNFFNSTLSTHSAVVGPSSLSPSSFLLLLC